MPAALALLLMVASQIQMGSLRGRVLDPSGASVPAARVVLSDASAGFEREATTDGSGRFRFRSVPFGLYALRVQASGFRTGAREVGLRSSLPVLVELELELAGTAEALTVRAEPPLLDPRAPGASTRMDEELLTRFPAAPAMGGVQQLVATAPGWASEDNGLLHARGVDDGFLYVVGGVPLPDRIDALFSSHLDLSAIESIEILAGHLPVEYGSVSGGVIRIVPRSGLDRPWGGDLALDGGSERTGRIGGATGGRMGAELGLFLLASMAGSGRRYLDPVDPENFNNRGAAFRTGARLDWQATSRDLLKGDLSVNGSGFRVTNSLQQELAGQRQRQELRDRHYSVLWQRSWSAETVTELSGYRRRFEAELLPSEHDVPLSASQDRSHVRQGALLNLTHLAGEHNLEAGADLQHLIIEESFAFFATDPDAAEESGLSAEALRFHRGDPFRFEDRASRWQVGAYLQDTFTAFSRLTVNAGVRFDRTSALVEDSQLAPRIGAVYHLPATDTAIRGSYNRLFKPPQVENLLLSSSPEARRLSPFQTNEGEGGAEIAPERQHAFEVGFGQSLGHRAALDLAYWRRSVRNYADPNVFFGTTVLFPNSVAEGAASGVDVRLEVANASGFSGFLSYSNSLVYQVGPINGGLFLEEEVLEIGPGVRFTPDHDQRNVGAFGIVYAHAKSGLWAGLYGRHESGTPLEIEEDELHEALERRGAELVDFDRGRVKPRTLLDLSLGASLFRGRRIGLELGLDVRNLGGARFAYNFANPFSGTHFGHPTLVTLRFRLRF